MDCAFVGDLPFIESIAPEIKLLKSLVINKHKDAMALPVFKGLRAVFTKTWITNRNAREYTQNLITLVAQGVKVIPNLITLLNCRPSNSR